MGGRTSRCGGWTRARGPEYPGDEGGSGAGCDRRPRTTRPGNHSCGGRCKQKDMSPDEGVTFPATPTAVRLHPPVFRYRYRCTACGHEYLSTWVAGTTEQASSCQHCGCTTRDFVDGHRETP